MTSVDKISLKDKLNTLIKTEGYVPYEKIVGVVIQEGYKISQAERRLRPSESPNIKAVMRKSQRGTNYIAGYEWRDSPAGLPEEKRKKEVKVHDVIMRELENDES